MHSQIPSAILLLSLCFSVANGQLSGRVGPTTTREAKQGTVCNVLKYGGVASKTSDIGPAIESAFAACKNGGTGEFFHHDPSPLFREQHLLMLRLHLKSTCLRGSMACRPGHTSLAVRTGRCSWMGSYIEQGKDCGEGKYNKRDRCGCCS